MAGWEGGGGREDVAKRKIANKDSDWSARKVPLGSAFAVGVAEDERSVWREACGVCAKAFGVLTAVASHCANFYLAMRKEWKLDEFDAPPLFLNTWFDTLLRALFHHCGGTSYGRPPTEYPLWNHFFQCLHRVRCGGCGV
jgi:hypothetical protein